MKTRPGILVLCTGNSCRSQIAEAYLRQLGGDRFRVYSAGTEPTDRVHPLTIEVLAEEGIDIGDAKPTDYRQYFDQIPVDYLITVCDGAAEACPAFWPGVHERLPWPFEDPAAFEGSPAETLERFRQVRDQIKARVRAWLDSQPEPGSPRA
jgi:arsenate reductase